MIAGSFTSFNGIDAGRIIRLNSDGLRDATFNAGSGFTSSIVYATAQQADGKIIVGSFTKYNTTTKQSGSTLADLDPTFTVGWVQVDL
jgi:hypothetical protein